MEVIFINTLKFKRLAPRATPREPPSRIPLVKYSKAPKHKATLGFLRELQQGCDVGLEPTTTRTTIWCSTN